MKQPVSCLDEIVGLGIGDVEEFLWVEIDEGKPAALHLHHHTVPPSEDVANVGHGVFDFK